MTYGCYNRPPLNTHVVVQQGWDYHRTLPDNVLRRSPVLVRLPDPMSKDCRYSIDSVDPRCAGCAHNQSNSKGPV